MKKAIFILAIVFGLSLSIAEAKNPAPYGRVSFTIFYTSLSPYGEWIEIDYGVYAWRPLYVKVGWSPYLIGRWVWTPYGWYWDSFEPFGWAVYHYGRWYYDDTMDGSGSLTMNGLPPGSSGDIQIITLDGLRFRLMQEFQ